MRFDVEDFGVVADGLCLESVSITAGTNKVHVGDGSIFSAAEVGKRMAIPGAVDMQATVVEVLDARRVRLSDHARATVGPLTVALDGRSVHDATMTAGSKVLTSDTAAFSAGDLTTPVVIRGAGHLNTTITAAVDDSTVRVADLAVRTVTDGIADVWNAESGALDGFRAIWPRSGATGVGPAEVVFGPGVFDFRRLPKQPGVLLDAAIGLDVWPE